MGKRIPPAAQRAVLPYLEKAASEFVPEAWAHEIERALAKHGLKLSPAGERAAIEEYVAAGGPPTADGVSKVVDKVVGTTGGTEALGEGSAAAANLRSLKNSDMGRPGGVPPIEPGEPAIEAPMDAWQRMTNEANHMEALGTTPKVPSGSGAPEGAAFAGNANAEPWQGMVDDANRMSPRAEHAPDEFLGASMPDVEGAVGAADKTLRNLKRAGAATAAAGAGGAAYSLIAGPGSGTDTDPNRVGPPKSAKMPPPTGGDESEDDSIPEQDWEKEERRDKETAKADPEAFDDAVEDTASKGGHVPSQEAARAASKVAAVKTPTEFYRLLGAAKARENKLGSMKEQDASLWEGKRDKIWELYQENKNHTDWVAAADVFGQLLVQWMAGAQGMRTGVDMSGVKFKPNDWSKSYDRLLDEARLQLKDVDTAQAHDQHRVDQLNKEIADARKATQTASENIGTFEGKAGIAAQGEQTQRDVAAGHDRTSVQVANINAASREGKEAGKDPYRAAKVHLAESFWKDAEKALKDFDGSDVGVIASDMNSKDATRKAAAFTSLKHLASASGDPELLAVVKDYGKNPPSGWDNFAAKLGGDDPMAKLNTASAAARAKLAENATKARETYARVASGGGDDEAPADGMPPRRETTKQSTIAEGSRTRDKKTNTPLIYRNGRWVEDK